MLTRKSKKIILIILTITAIFFSCILFKMFVFKEARSDIDNHIVFALSGNNYSLISSLILLFLKIFKNDYSIVFLCEILLLFTSIVTFFSLNYFKDKYKMELDALDIMALSVFLLFICKICIPIFSFSLYKNSFSTQPWHNTTYLLLRPISILTLTLYFNLYDKYLSNIRWYDYIIFTVLLIITNYAKPNFIIVFAPCMFLVLLKNFIKNKGGKIKKYILFGSCVLVSLLVLIYQYKMLYGGDNTNTICFSFKLLIDNIMGLENITNLFSSLLFVIFVLIIVLLNKKKINQNIVHVYCQSWLMFLISFVESNLLFEVGPRANDGNFTWNNFLFSYWLYMVSIVIFVDMYKKNKIKKEIYYIGLSIFALHIFCGFVYFILLLVGKTPWKF